MVVNGDTQKPSGLGNALGDLNIGLARLGISARVIMHQNQRASTNIEAALDHFARVNTGLVNRSVMDEVIDDVHAILKGSRDGAMDVVNIKISKFGGLTRARQARDLCVSLGLVMTLEDSWGGDIITAAIAHLAHSTPSDNRFTSTDFNSYGTKDIADGAPKRVNGRMSASKEPGLGITPLFDVLGKPVWKCGAD